MIAIKRIFFILIIIIISSSFTFSNEKVLKVGYYEDFPLNFKSDNGEPSGFVVDLINEIAKEEDFEIEFVYGIWTDLLYKLENEEIDIIINILKSEERSKKYSYIENPLFLSWGTLARNKKYEINTLLDLEGLKVGYLDEDYYAVEKGGLMDSVSEFQLNVEFIPYKTYEEVLTAVNNDEINCGVINKVTVRKIYEYNNVRKTPLIFGASGIRIASKKNLNKEYLNIIDSYIVNWKKDSDSFYYKKYDEWFGDIKRNQIKIFYFENRKSILLVIVVILLIISYSRIQVMMKTKKISKINKNLELTNIKLKEKNIEINGMLKENDLLVKRFENLMKFLTSNLKVLHNKDEYLYSSELLREAFSLIDEASCGFVYTYNDKNELIVVDSINAKRPDFRNIKRKEVPWFGDKVIIIDNFLQKMLSRMDNEEAIKQIKNQMNFMKETLFMNFYKGDEIFGGLILQIDKESDLKFSDSSIKIMEALKNISESYLLNEKYYEMHNNYQKNIILSFIELLEVHDEYTRGHSESVARLSKALASELNFSNEKVEEMFWAGLVHDIGKVLIPAEIINKKGKLTNAEYSKIKRHSEFGYRGLLKTDLTKNIARSVLYHHERIDGSGYPEGLAGEDIPIESRIIALADAYDAMTSQRSYKNVMSKADALNEIKNNLGTQFDEKLGIKFIKMIERSEELWVK